MSGEYNRVMVSASLVLTMAFLAVGISFFGPYWLSNVPAAKDNEWNFTSNVTFLILAESVYSYDDFQDRGLWAQCGVYCYWFWNNGYLLQTVLLTPLKWHLATQVLYFIAAVLVLFCEFFARVQWCCDERRKGVSFAIGIILLASVLIQTAALAAFGGGACRWPYNAISDPRQFTYALGRFNSSVAPYLGWCFWMAVVGDLLSLVSAVLFILASVCCAAKRPVATTRKGPVKYRAEPPRANPTERRDAEKAMNSADRDVCSNSPIDL